MDNDCDGDIDEDDAVDVETFYADGDGDGFGDLDVTTAACEVPSGYSSDSSDCDDDESAINSDAEEVCDDVDNDCDGDIDEDDAVDVETFYADGDGDGFGDLGVTTAACAVPSGYSSDSSDCDDGEADTNPDAEEVCDDVDNNCDDEIDEGCRPDVSCTHPDTTTLASSDPSGVSDIVFSEDCVAYVSTIISGQDYVYMIESDGSASSIKGYSVWNIQSLAIEPSTGDIAISHNDNRSAGIGVLGSGTAFPNTVSFTYNNSSLWSNTYMNRSQASLVWDSDGYIWVINASGSGSLSQMESDGSNSSLFTGKSHLESVALDSGDNLYVAIGDTVYSVDKSTGTLTSYFVAGDSVLDMIFDYNDDLYVENDSGELELVPGDGSSDSVYATLSGQGRLAISPDGWLVRAIPSPTGAATYEEWELGD